MNSVVFVAYIKCDKDFVLRVYRSTFGWMCVNALARLYRSVMKHKNIHNQTTIALNARTSTTRKFSLLSNIQSGRAPQEIISQSIFDSKLFFSKHTFFGNSIESYCKIKFHCEFSINTLNYLRGFYYKQRKIVILIPELFTKKQKLDSFWIKK